MLVVKAAQARSHDDTVASTERIQCFIGGMITPEMSCMTAEVFFMFTVTAWMTDFIVLFPLNQIVAIMKMLNQPKSVMRMERVRTNDSSGLVTRRWDDGQNVGGDTKAFSNPDDFNHPPDSKAASSH